MIGETQTTISSWCCFLEDSGPIDMIARVPFGGYALGQTINVEIAVNNRTDKVINTMMVELDQVSMMLKSHWIALILKHAIVRTDLFSESPLLRQVSKKFSISIFCSFAEISGMQSKQSSQFTFEY